MGLFTLGMLGIGPLKGVFGHDDWSSRSRRNDEEQKRGRAPAKAKEPESPYRKPVVHKIGPKHQK